MDFYTLFDDVVDLLRQRQRVTYRALQRQFDLDEETLNDLKDELLYAQHVARDEDGRVLVWTGTREATHRDIEQVLADTLAMIWATIEPGPELEAPVSTLTDEEVLALADAKMDPIQDDRLAELQTRGKAAGLTEAERVELLSLLHLYQVGQLRKSEGSAAAVRRGLRSPLRP
jgi:hypothetical protein